ncbi:MAG: PKD domain-containing protein [Saprospiraceae bacterium]
MKTIFNGQISWPLFRHSSGQMLIVRKLLIGMGMVLFSIPSLFSQNQFLFGEVVYGEAGEPLPGYPVQLSYQQVEWQVFTNEAGFFTAELQNVNGDELITVRVFDFCTGTALKQELMADSAYVFFHVCPNLVNPPGVEGCEAFFTYEQVGFGPYNLFFQNISFSSGGVDSVRWVFGDGNTSSERDPIHTYAEVGTYTASLTIFSDSCQSTFTQIVQVLEQGNCDCDEVYIPTCVMTANGVQEQFANPCEALCAGYSQDMFIPCEVDNCSCPEYYEPVCAVVNGDTLQFSNICFAACEGYTPEDVFLCYPDSNDCNCPAIYDPVCVLMPNGIIQTYANACVAFCEGITTPHIVPCEPDSCWCDTVYDPVCVLDANGGLFEFSNSCEAQCAGYLPHELIPCDSMGNPCDTILIPCDSLGVVCDTIILPCDSTGYYCQADFSIDYSNLQSLEVAFMDHSFSIDGEVIGWKWDFGDGQTSEDANPVHFYQTSGIYEVILAIETSTGCSSTIVQHICIGDTDVVEGPACQAIFFFEQMGTSSSFQFMDVSLGDVVNWKWDFGDGESSVEPMPIHTYEQPGVYVVTLTIRTAAGCESRISVLLTTADNIFYEEECRALFLPFMSPDSLLVFFLNLSTPNATSFFWDFGDNSTSSEFIPAHTYATGGVYTVTLTITTADGCSSSYSTIINFNSNDFTASPMFRMVSGTAEVEKTPTIEKLMPNPVSDQLNLVIDGVKTAAYQLQVFNLQGQVMLTKQGELYSGEQTISLPVHDFPEGMYLLRMRTGGHESSKKFIKQ